MMLAPDQLVCINGNPLIVRRYLACLSGLFRRIFEVITLHLIS